MSLAELLPFVLIGGVFWLLVMRPSKKRRDEHNRMMATLVPGARIMTTAGLFGTVIEVESKEVSVEIAPGVVVQMVSQAIANIVPPQVDEDDSLDPLDALEAELAADDRASDLDDHRDGEPGQGIARG